jgi:hypothetical protein
VEDEDFFDQHFDDAKGSESSVEYRQEPTRTNIMMTEVNDNLNSDDEIYMDSPKKDEATAF